MYCSNCGSKLVEGANFCTECGTKVIRIEDVEKIDTTEVAEEKKESIENLVEALQSTKEETNELQEINEENSIEREYNEDGLLLLTKEEEALCGFWDNPSYHYDQITKLKEKHANGKITDEKYEKKYNKYVKDGNEALYRLTMEVRKEKEEKDRIKLQQKNERLAKQQETNRLAAEMKKEEKQATMATLNSEHEIMKFTTSMRGGGDSLKCTITNQRLLIDKKMRMSKKHLVDIELYRIEDIVVKRKTFGKGSLHILSSDLSHPSLKLSKVNGVDKVYDTLRAAVRADKSKKH